MAIHNPKEFDGCCPFCGRGADFLDRIHDDLKYYCFTCRVIIVVDDVSDEIIETYEN